VRATAFASPLPALTLTTYARPLNAAIFGHRLYVADDLVILDASRRRVLAPTYGREVRRIAAWAADTLARADDLTSESDARLDATLGTMHDELAWLCWIARIGADLDGEPLANLDGLITSLPSGAPLGAGAVAAGRHAAGRALAERAALAIGQALAACVNERAGRLAAGGAIGAPADVEHLTWDELLGAPGGLDAVIERRRAEHARLGELALPRTVSALPTGIGLALSIPEPVAA
jgi:hypothetical protein